MSSPLILESSISRLRLVKNVASSEVRREARKESNIELRKQKKNKALENKRKASSEGYEEFDGVCAGFDNDFDISFSIEAIIAGIKKFLNDYVNPCYGNTTKEPNLTIDLELIELLDNATKLIIRDRQGLSLQPYRFNNVSHLFSKIPLREPSIKSFSAVETFFEAGILRDILAIWNYFCLERKLSTCESNIVTKITHFFAFYFSLPSSHQVFGDSEWQHVFDLCWFTFNHEVLNSIEIHKNLYFFLSNVIQVSPVTVKLLLTTDNLLTNLNKHLNDILKFIYEQQSKEPRPRELLTDSIAIYLLSLTSAARNYCQNATKPTSPGESPSKCLINRNYVPVLLNSLKPLVDLDNGLILQNILYLYYLFSSIFDPTEFMDETFLRKLPEFINTGFEEVVFLANSICINLIRFGGDKAFNFLITQLNYFSLVPKLLRRNSDIQIQTVNLLDTLTCAGGLPVVDLILAEPILPELVELMYNGDYPTMARGVILLKSITQSAHHRWLEDFIRFGLIHSIVSRLTVHDNDTVMATLQVYENLIEMAKKHGSLEDLIHRFEQDGVFLAIRSNEDSVRNPLIVEKIEKLSDFAALAESESDLNLLSNDNEIDFR